MSIRLKPCAGKVFINPEETKPADTNLVLPETSCNREMPCIGEVFAIGGRRITKKGVVLDHEFKVGDRVFFRKYSGVWVDIRGHKLIQIEQKDVEAILS